MPTADKNTRGRREYGGEKRHCLATKIILPFALVALLGAQASGAITVVIDPGVAPFFSVPNVVDFSPNGFSMAGMRVTATFSDSSTETVTWHSTDAISGEATGTNWLLRESGDTFDQFWELQNNKPFVSGSSLSMTRLVIEGGAFGNTLFDAQGNGDAATAMIPGREPSATNAATGTVGSQLGGTFDPLNAGSLNITATYKNAVQLGAAGPVGDLFTTLDIAFLGSGLRGLDFFSQGAPLQFRADTDLWGTVVPQTTDLTPEPSSLLIFVGFGLAGLWHQRRKRKGD
jgi:PEP-CTERM motif